MQCKRHKRVENLDALEDLVQIHMQKQMTCTEIASISCLTIAESKRQALNPRPTPIRQTMISPQEETEISF